MEGSDFSVLGRQIGTGHPPFIVAELSGNHNGELSRALKLIEAAAEAGADAVKFQTYTADTLTIDHDSPDFTISGGLWSGRRLYELYQQASTPWEWHEALYRRARELGIVPFSTPFDESAVDFLETLDNPVYKIASFEAIDLALIAKAASTRKPMIISTGMTKLEEIDEAVATAKSHGAARVALLHCVSAYPAPAEEANLRTVPDVAARFGVVSGLSDHTIGIAVAIAAVSLGASIIEKHVTLRRGDGGPDAAFSLEPNELKQLVEGCRTAWAALGNVSYDRVPSEIGSMKFRRSLYVVQNVKAGEELTHANVRSIRPGYGLPPKELSNILGRSAKTDLAKGTPLSWSLIA